MDKDERLKRLVRAADFQGMSVEALKDSLGQLAAVPGLNWPEINKAANAADLALRALRACYAIDAGRAVMGDSLDTPAQTPELHPHHALASSEAGHKRVCGSTFENHDCDLETGHTGSHVNKARTQSWDEVHHPRCPFQRAKGHAMVDCTKERGHAGMHEDLDHDLWDD